jgi:hypothetical protein
MILKTLLQLYSAAMSILRIILLALKCHVTHHWMFNGLRNVDTQVLLSRLKFGSFFTFYNSRTLFQNSESRDAVILQNLMEIH